MFYFSENYFQSSALSIRQKEKLIEMKTDISFEALFKKKCKLTNCPYGYVNQSKVNGQSVYERKIIEIRCITEITQRILENGI